jgi:acetylornithine deacetylase/succinyl-diaminopimelate desuccinylase-like protein
VGSGKWWWGPFLCLLVTVSSQAQQIEPANEATRKLAVDIFKQLIEINTTDSVGSVTAASEAMAKRFRDAGFAESDIKVLGPNDRKKNVVVRLHGSGKHKPVLLIGHLDVVEARREDWTSDPFQFVEKDGFYYGRGTSDMKDGDAIMSATLIRMKKEGYVPSRDIILAMTADEEGGTSNGVDWLIKNHRDLIDAEFVLNHDGGGVLADHGKPLMMEVDATEKLYGDFVLTATNPGGHSSLPRPENAIYELANALTRIEHYQFPFELNNITRAFYERQLKMAQASHDNSERAADLAGILKTPPDLAAVARLSKDPMDNSTMHTTCVATRLSGGHANNALPQMAQANINCRIEPGHSLEEIRLALEKAVADPKNPHSGVTHSTMLPSTIKVQYRENTGVVMDHGSDRHSYLPPPPRKEVFDPLEKVVAQMWPGIPVLPAMSTGASDGVYTNSAGMPTYGVSGEQYDRDDVRAHGKDERVGVESFARGVDFYYVFLKGVTGE